MKAKSQITYVGADVSKDHLDVCHPSWSKPRRFANAPGAIRSLLSILGKQDDCVQLVIEATGGYERPLLRACWRAGLPISMINPRQMRDFAKGAGLLAKTDQIDAAALAQFGACHQPAASQPLPALQEELRDIARHRDELVAERTRQTSRLAKQSSAFVKGQMRSMLRIIEARIAKCEAQLAKLIASDRRLSSNQQRIEQIKGAGRVLSNTLLAELPELGTLSDRKITALAGLAPYAKDSGKWRGTRMIIGGRARVRRSLYMPALSAIRHNPVLRDFHDRLIARGKPSKVAITAVMRKLLCVLNRMIADPDFSPC